MSVLDQSFQEKQGCFGFGTGSSSEPSKFDFVRKTTANEDAAGLLSNQDQRKKQEIEDMLSDALNKLTFEERQEQQEVLHGVDGKIREEATFVKNSLKDLDNFLNRTKRGSVYEIAESMNAGYVGAKPLRLMFLRGNRYDAKAAANQMIRFFAQKEKIFGTEKLVKDITIEDLDQDDLAFLKSGCMQLGGNDRSNRQLIFQFPGIRNFKTLQNELRTRYFLAMSALQSEEAQIRGAVVITYTVGEYRDNKEGGGYMENMRLAMSLPVYVAANLMCCDEYAEYLLASTVVKAMPVKLRARFRSHYGSHVECRYQLSTYGIAPHLIPIDPMTNALRLEYHLNWYHSCLLTASRPNSATSEQSEKKIIEVKPDDVLFLGGKKSNNAGNLRLRTLIKTLSPVYTSATNEKKRLIVDGMIGDIHKSGGRFLKDTKGSLPSSWSELSLEDARTRITQAFRNHRRQPNTTQQKEASGTPITDTPGPNDIVFGIGKTKKSRGRELLQHLIKEQSEDYDALDRGMKVKVVDAIIGRVQSEGGRFLLPKPGDNNGGWLEVSNEAARGRIRKYFRNNRRTSRKKGS
mmetsp:Transcript_17683/g.43592  ORF Transcript_17683/g.43592 Transcript_17683/m.43592 type:complete len:575 (-) Transcript_17683:176-1900(-)